MASKTKLLIIPCSNHETEQLARDVYEKLQKDYELDNQVELLTSHRKAEIPRDTVKDSRHPSVADYFPDYEVQVDIGRNELKDVIRGKHVVLVEHLLTPARKVQEDFPQMVSVNDHIMTVRGFLDVIGKTDTIKRTLLAPYLSYVRSHSIEKYESRGFYQFDSLRRTLNDFRKDGLDGIITIDPHSEKAQQIALELGMEYRSINPFQSGRAINPYKLGLKKGRKGQQIMKRLRPFQERFGELKEKYKGHLYVVSIDDGTETRSSNFTERAFSELSIEEVYSLMVFCDKDRVSYEHSTSSFKPFSAINESNIDPEGVYIIIDDMAASLGTGNTGAKVLKILKAKRVELWASHAVTTPNVYQKANDRTYIDQVVCLDTVPQSPELNIEYIKASADLLASELYKVHQKLVASR